jgi:hypothetical protein
VIAFESRLLDGRRLRADIAGTVCDLAEEVRRD